jgi:hypothetical protein
MTSNSVLGDGTKHIYHITTADMDFLFFKLGLSYPLSVLV